MNKSTPYSETLVQRLAQARRVLVFTGAGISAESGIPTFRDADGLWETFKPEELANVDAFLGNPDLVQRWYAMRRDVVTRAAPNAGHHALVELEKMVDEFMLVTQNVDNLHNEAGSKEVVELHGNLTRNYCIDCKQQVDDVPPVEPGKPLACQSCGGFIRPDVVWFGEMLPPGAMEIAINMAMRSDVVLSVGTSAVVFPAADIPLAARGYGAYVAEININKSEIAHALNETVLGPSGTVLPSLVAAVKERRQATTA